MKLNVPFYVQGINECGPVVLKMVLEYFGKNLDLNEIKKIVDSEKSGITYSLGLAKASSRYGFKTELFSISLEPVQSNYDMDFYKKNTEGFENAKKIIKKLKKECIKNGAILKEKSLSTSDILSKINKDCLAIALLD